MLTREAPGPAWVGEAPPQGRPSRNDEGAEQVQPLPGAPSGRTAGEPGVPVVGVT